MQGLAIPCHPKGRTLIHKVAFPTCRYIKYILVRISMRTGMTMSQVTDEELYTRLIEMHELVAPGE